MERVRQIRAALKENGLVVTICNLVKIVCSTRLNEKKQMKMKNLEGLEE